MSETDNVVFGTITFSDRTVVEFGELEPTGLPTEITTISAVIHVVGDDTTMSVGLDEVEFYGSDNINVATDAAASASSVMADGTDNEERSASWYPEGYTDWYAARKAINGYANANLPEGAEYEWASQGEPNPTITFSWFPAVKIGTIVLYDRINADDHVIGGTIEFSDGTQLDFDEIPNDGAPYYIDVNDVEADSFTIYTYTEGPNPGFAEVEVYTEHFDDGKPVGETEAGSDGIKTEEAVPAENEEDVNQPAEAEKNAESNSSELRSTAAALKTFDITTVCGFAVLASAAAYFTKKSR